MMHGQKNIKLGFGGLLKYSPLGFVFKYIARVFECIPWSN